MTREQLQTVADLVAIAHDEYDGCPSYRDDLERFDRLLAEIKAEAQSAPGKASAALAHEPISAVLAETRKSLLDDSWIDEITALDEDGEPDDFARRVVPLESALEAIDRIKAAAEEGGPDVNRLPPVLDATCGSRMIHFDPNCPDVLFCDRRECDGEAIWKGGSHGKPSTRHLNVHPDRIVDFTRMPFPDESFFLVVFDPPHLVHIGENAWMRKKYGKLERDWPAMLRDGFRECWRVLKPGGSLIFKWSEYQIPVARVWEAIGARPIFGTRCGKSAKTIWATFFKSPAAGSASDRGGSTEAPPHA